MTVITCEQLPELFAAVGGLFTEKRDELCEMDAQMGDGDLGLTMEWRLRCPAAAFARQYGAW